MEKASFNLPVRDNRNRHYETSTAPSGFWSSTDIPGQILLPSSLPYYLLAYAPVRASLNEGCHRIRVEVNRPGVRVWARDEYCEGQTSSDLLNGTKIGKKLESELAQAREGTIPLFLQAGAFRKGRGQQLAEVVVEFPWNQLSHSWDTRIGRLHASIAVLGAVYTRDGKLVTRLSDLLYPSYWPTVLKGTYYAGGYLVDTGDADPRDTAVTYSIFYEHDPGWLPTRFETQLQVPPGEYDVRVVLSDGVKHGRAQARLAIENDDGKSLALGSVFLCKHFRDAHVAAIEAAAAKFAPQYVPLVSKNVRFTPAGDTKFLPGEQLFAYFEIYDPIFADKPTPQIQAHLRITDVKSGHLVKEFPTVDAATYAQAGSTVIPIAREIPITTLVKGEYRLEVQATDSSGRSTSWRAATFTIAVQK